MTSDSPLQPPRVACAALFWLSERPQSPLLVITLGRVRNPSAPSSEEVWQQLRQHRAEIPARLEAQRTRMSLASLKPPAQVEQHESSSHDTWHAIHLLIFWGSLQCLRLTWSIRIMMGAIVPANKGLLWSSPLTIARSSDCICCSCILLH